MLSKNLELPARRSNPRVGRKFENSLSQSSFVLSYSDGPRLLGRNTSVGTHQTKSLLMNSSRISFSCKQSKLGDTAVAFAHALLPYERLRCRGGTSMSFTMMLLFLFFFPVEPALARETARPPACPVAWSPDDRVDYSGIV